MSKGTSDKTALLALVVLGAALASIAMMPSLAGQKTFADGGGGHDYHDHHHHDRDHHGHHKHHRHHHKHHDHDYCGC